MQGFLLLLGTGNGHELVGLATRVATKGLSIPSRPGPSLSSAPASSPGHCA
jgi:hypothetical protein